MDRNLDGVYFRMQRENKWTNVCFSDLTEAEMDQVLEKRDIKWCKSLCSILGETLEKICSSCQVPMPIPYDKATMERVYENADLKWHKDFCKCIGQTIKAVGDTYDIIAAYSDDSDY